jgi:hypothetical protein
MGDQEMLQSTCRVFTHVHEIPQDAEWCAYGREDRQVKLPLCSSRELLIQ